MINYSGGSGLQVFIQVVSHGLGISTIVTNDLVILRIDKQLFP